MKKVKKSGLILSRGKCLKFMVFGDLVHVCSNPNPQVNRGITGLADDLSGKPKWRRHALD